MKKVAFIEMMGTPGSYDASVYDHFEDKDQEGLWFIKRFSYLQNFAISTFNICINEKLPEPREMDGLVLAGSYNSVHDHTDWQQKIRKWLPQMRAEKTPILAICGSHQLLSNMNGAGVKSFEGGPYAGSFAVHFTPEGRSCPLLTNIPDGALFQFANTEHVTDVPKGSTLLATSGRVSTAALDFGHHCYSTQFHPEGTHETLSAVWRFKAPENKKRYVPEENGKRLIENFFRIISDQ